MQKKLLMLLVAIGLVANGASAADLPHKAPVAPTAAPFSWTGFYIGANGGYGWQDGDGGINYFFDRVPGVISNTEPSFDAKGGFGGGQIGYNYQIGRSVLGIEADFQGSGIQGSFNRNPAPGAFCCSNPNDIFSGDSKLNWFGTVRGRFGVAFNNLLLYATGGFAYGHVEESLTAVNPQFSPPLLFFSAGGSKTLTGGVMGVGVEYGILPAWSVKAEYQYMDLGSTTPTGTTVLNGSDHADVFGHKYHTVRIGINYHFGPSGLIR